VAGEQVVADGTTTRVDGERALANARQAANRLQG
jgi:hypothetical protein